MQNLKSSELLSQTILVLEAKQSDEAVLFKEKIQGFYESLMPINLIKNSLNQMAGTDRLKDNLISASIGIAAGYLSKRIFEGLSSSPFRRFIGTFIMYIIANSLARNLHVINFFVRVFIHFTSKLKQKAID